ncbi:Unknown protein sequence [Pseudomonas savastanoi pv. savastanoi]|nr:Unknown protein sequence [Pseudomonas savastanoi pv. savastanoi]
MSARACDAERHELHADAEHRHDSRLKMFIVPMLRVGMPFWTLCVQS